MTSRAPAKTPMTPIPKVSTHFSMSDKDNEKADEYNVIAIRQYIATRYLEGATLAVIANELECSMPNISYHLKKIRQQWLESTLQKFDERKAQECAKIDHIEEMAWQSFYKSCADAVTTSEEVEESVRAIKDDEGKVLSEGLAPTARKRKTLRKGQAGDPRWLERISWCVDQRCKIFGVYKDNPTNVNNVVINFDDLFGKTSAEERRDPVKHALDRVRQLEPVNEPDPAEPQPVIPKAEPTIIHKAPPRLNKKG
jgi:hypothetical protein